MWAIGEPSGPMEKGTTYIVRPSHGAAVQRQQLGLHLRGCPPVVGRTGVDLPLGADERAILDPGDVAGIGQGQEAVRALGVVRADERPAVDQQLA